MKQETITSVHVYNSQGLTPGFQTSRWTAWDDCGYIIFNGKNMLHCIFYLLVWVKYNYKAGNTWQKMLSVIIGRGLTKVLSGNCHYTDNQSKNIFRLYILLHKDKVTAVTVKHFTLPAPLLAGNISSLLCIINQQNKSNR